MGDGMISNYAETKLILLDAINRPPIVLHHYRMLKYSKISIGKTINCKDMFILRPSDTISIRFEYCEDITNCLGMVINGVECGIYWKHDRIMKWLSKNCQEL